MTSHDATGLRPTRALAPGPPRYGQSRVPCGAQLQMCLLMPLQLPYDLSDLRVCLRVAVVGVQPMVKRFVALTSVSVQGCTPWGSFTAQQEVCQQAVPASRGGGRRKELRHEVVGVLQEAACSFEKAVHLPG